MELIKGENVLHSFKENFLEYTYLKKSYNTGCFEVYCKQCNSLQPAILVADLFTSEEYFTVEQGIPYSKNKGLSLLFSNLKFEDKLACFVIDNSYYLNWNFIYDLIGKAKDTLGISENKEVICRTCGRVHSLKYHFFLRDKNTYNHKYASLVFAEDGKNGKYLKFISYFIEYSLQSEKKQLVTTRYREKVTMNITTGQTYKVRRKYLSCNRVPRGALVRNVSYLGAINPIQAGVDFVLDIRKNKEDFKKIVEYVLDEKTKILGHVPDGYDKENENIRDIVSLIAFNRFPNIPPRKIISTLQYRSGKDMIRIIKSTDSQWQKIILESNKIKSTKFTKKVLAESDDFYTVLKIMKFFKKPDNVKKMLVAPGAYLRDILDFDIFMADHIERFGETLFCNKFLSEDWTHITFDTAMMYEDLKEQMGNKKLVIPSGSIRELHNKYMVERGRIREKNIVFSLPKRAIKMNDEDSVFEISAAEDSNTLTRIGDDLRICVGSYKHKVNSGTSYIYELKRNKEAVACIETSGNLKKVIQAKSKFNDQIVGDDLDFVLGWIRKNKLKIDTADLEVKNWRVNNES